MNVPAGVGIGGACWLILAWALPPALRLPGNKTLALQLILTVVGLALAGLLIWYSRKRRPAGADPAQPIAGSMDRPMIEAVLREAETKLADSSLGRNARLSRMPLIFLLGPDGSAKTTTVLQSGLEPELLAGQVHQEGVVVPTLQGNAWLAQQTVFLEVGSGAQADVRTWPTLGLHAQARKIEAALGRAAAVPRAVVVCYECENLLKAGAAEASAEAAKTIRAQLFTLSSQIGANLPVYVLFTKLDRVAFFFDFVRNLAANESREILGTTLEAEKPHSGVYGEREAARLTQAFHELAVSLSNRRTELLAREGDAEAVLSAYEFPREFRKLRSATVRFLLEICRPSQLATGPFLRGFYFCGVRPVIVNDEIGTDVNAATPARVSQPTSADATSIFSYRGPIAAAIEPAVPQTSKRKIPEWVFLPSFFRDVVLADRSGLTVSAVSSKTSLPRRLLLATITGLCVLLGMATLVSYLNNRRLVDSVRQAASEVSADRTAAGEVSLEALTKLDHLRTVLGELTGYERSHPPLGLRWGLYTGSAILPDTRALYFARFRALLLSGVQTDLLKTMASWPATPPQNADYGSSYNTLKAYLETTLNHDKATLQFLPPVLQEHSARNVGSDPKKVALARAQFEFYTSELMIENPYPPHVEAPVVAKARQYLNQFGGVDRIYQGLLAEANQSGKRVSFNQRFPNPAVSDGYEVPAAFTKTGFAVMQNALKDPARHAGGEKWVLGDQGAQSVATPELIQQIQSRYYRDYIAAWREYLKRGMVLRYVSLGDAAKKLAVTSSPQSPLLALFWLASQNTDVPAPPVQQAFKPLHVIMPATNVDQYVGGANQNYMSSLTTLQNSIEQAVQLPPEQSQAAGDQTGSAASSALLATRQTALTLGLDAEAHIEAVIQRLMTDPITHLDAVKPNGPSPVPLNAAGADFCSKYRSLMAKFPFDTSSKVPATIDEVNSIFRPQSGALWQFHQQKLEKMLVKQGSYYVAVPGVKPELTGRFVGFFNRAAELSRTLYAGGTSQDPKINFALQPAFSADVQSVTLTVDGQTATLQAASPAQHFSWTGNGGGIRLTARSGGTDFQYPSYPGTWGVFEFFYDADKPLPSPEWMLKGGHSNKPVTSPVTNQPINVHFNLDMLGGAPIFQRGNLRDMACVAEVAK